MRTRSAFTLVELLVVIVIIAILAASLVVLIKGMIERGRQAATKSMVDVLSMACADYRTDYGCYPPTSPYTGSQNLHYYLGAPRTIEVTTGITSERKPFIEFKRDWLDATATSTLPPPPAYVIDRWSQPIHVQNPGTNNPKGVDIWSDGRDPADAGDDLANWIRD
jgi:prepilin-type N-terminal cleavage/methylation domain-containing protein